MLSERYVIPGSEEMGTSQKVVYFMQAGDNGPIKIGYSGKLAGVWERLVSVQCGCPWPVTVRSVIAADGVGTERELHRRFSRHRLNGEWFVAVPELAALAQAAPMGEAGQVADRLLRRAWDAGYQEGRCDGEWEAHKNLRRRLERMARDLAPDCAVAEEGGIMGGNDLEGGGVMPANRGHVLPFQCCRGRDPSPVSGWPALSRLGPQSQTYDPGSAVGPGNLWRTLGGTVPPMLPKSTDSVAQRASEAP